MDDERIQELTEEVLGKLAERPETADLEHRIGALEHAAGHRKAIPPGARAKHVALRIIEIAARGEDECLLEPGKPCSNSGRCRSFGY